MDFLKGGLMRIGLMKSIESVADHKDIYINEEMYNHIETWQALYKGYHEPWHLVRYNTIDGQKTRRMMTLNMAKTSAAEMASLVRSEEHTSELQSRGHIVCRLLL